jgi:hypothetical protein
MLLYVIALVAAMNIFLMQPDDPEGAIVSSIMITPLLTAFIIGEIALQGKENLLLFKQTPTTTSAFIRMKLTHYLLIILPLAVILEVIISLLVPSITFYELLFNVGFQFIMAIGLTLFSTGLFLRNPAYHEKAPEYMINMQVIIFMIMIPFFFGLILLDRYLYENFGIVESFYYVLMVVAIINMVLGTILLYIGKRHLDGLE